MSLKRPAPADSSAVSKLSDYNTRVQTERQPLSAAERAELTQRWLWECSLDERYVDEIAFNEAHLLGLLLARDLVLCLGPDAHALCSADIEHAPTRLTLAPQCAFNAMPSSVLLRTVENVQSAWATTMYAETRSAEEWEAAALLLDMAFHRFGVLCSVCSSDNALFDDPQATEVLPDGMFGLTQAATRAMLDAFVVLRRHVDLYRRARPPLVERDTAQLHRDIMAPHAVEACKDEFYRLSMHFDAFAGARLAYKHRFPGMYNCVSQVVYYHQENYERRRHGGSGAIDALPVLHHMYPEIPIVLEEEAPPTTGVFWFLLNGRIYLMLSRHGPPVLHEDPFQMFAARVEPPSSASATLS